MGTLPKLGAKSSLSVFSLVHSSTGPYLEGLHPSHIVFLCSNAEVKTAADGLGEHFHAHAVAMGLDLGS